MKPYGANRPEPPYGEADTASTRPVVVFRFEPAVPGRCSYKFPMLITAADEALFSPHVNLRAQLTFTLKDVQPVVTKDIRVVVEPEGPFGLQRLIIKQPTHHRIFVKVGLRPDEQLH